MSKIKTGTTLTTAYQVEGDTTGALVIQTGSTPTTAVTVAADQNVTVAGNVTLNNGTADGAQLTLSSSGYSDWNWDNYSGRLRAYYGSTEYFTINASGNVGIGTSSPSTKLHIAAAGGVAARIENTANSTNAVSYQLKNTTGGMYLGQDATGGYLLTDYAAPILFYTNNTERARIDSSGNLLVGTTSASGFPFVSPKMYLNNSGYNGIGVQNVGNGYIAFTTSPSANHSYFAGYYLNSSGTAVGSISVTSSSTTYGTSSDYRLKDNITPMTGALATVGRLKPVTYTWKSDGSDGQGFIAHELQEVVPDAVIGQKDAVETYVDEDGNEQTRPVYQGIDTSFLVATLTAAIQEQQTQIQDQLALITSLTARIEALEAK